MRIETSLDLQTQLLNGSHFALDGESRLHTQSGVSAFFQKIGDVFRGITESGRKKIEARNAALDRVMAETLGNTGKIPDLTAGRIPFPEPSENADVQTARLAFLRDLSKDSHGIPKNRIAHFALEVDTCVLGYLGNHRAPENMTFTEAYMAAAGIIAGDPAVRKIYRGPVSSSEQKQRREFIDAYIRQNYEPEYAGYVNQDTKIHSVFVNDNSVRGRDITVYNGRPVDAGSPADAGLLNLSLVDENLRPFVSTVASQNMYRAVPDAFQSLCRLSEDTENLGMSILNQIRHTASLDVSKDRITLTMQFRENLRFDGSAQKDPAASRILQLRIVIPQHQKITGSQLPVYTLSFAQLPENDRALIQGLDR